MKTVDWRSYAACLGMDTDIFFPAEYNGGDEALSVCAACPVRVQCLQYALGAKEAYGIWGGLREHERLSLMGGRKKRGA